VISTLTYFAFIDIIATPGVAKKVNNTVKAANSLGLNAKSKLYKLSLIDAMHFMIDVACCKSDVMFLRFSSLVSPFLFIPLLIAKARGVKIIYDIPTPRSVVLKELNTTVSNPVIRAIKKLVSISSASWVLFPANTIIQYAGESNWFSFGVKHKTLKQGNGIIIDETLPVCNASRSCPDINLIAVAQVADWHGYDRLIKAIKQLESENIHHIHFKLVGNGDALIKLKQLAKEIDVNNIEFTGELFNEDLSRAFENAHIGISSLGLHRKGLDEASDLKTREYMARGLTTIGVGSDPDFSENNEYRFCVTNDDTIGSIVELLKTLDINKLPTPECVREFANKNLTLKSKVKFILSSL